MGRRAAGATNKKEEILTAAQSCFLELGFDGTSVRTIMRKAGAEIGLFYYYFKNKDDAFERVLDRFFAEYEADFAQIVAHGKRNPCRVMEDFFAYMERETAAFRQKYAPRMHRTVRWAVREHALTLIEPYLKQIVEIQSRYYGVCPPIATEVTALYLTHGVGSCILHEDSEKYAANRVEVKRGVSLLMGMPMERQELRIPQPGINQDIEPWMQLVRDVRDSFPVLDEGLFEAQLAKRIADGEAWVFRRHGNLLAALLYSKERQELDFLAVSPGERRQGLAQKLMETAAAQFPVGTELSVVTYREDDPMGMAARAFYQRMGFIPGELLTLFGYPCQRLSVLVPDAPLGRK